MGNLPGQPRRRRQASHITPLGSLREKIDPNHAALIVIDMQNDFRARGGLVDKGGRDVSAVQDMARHLPALIESARKAGALVIFVRSVYTTDDNRYLSDVWLEQAARKQGGGYTQTPVCRDGSWEGDYYGDVRPLPGDIVVTKHRYNAFHKTDLDTILRANGVRHRGHRVSTNVSTVRELLEDYYVVPRDGTAAYSNEEHKRRATSTASSAKFHDRGIARHLVRATPEPMRRAS
jgi:ureidoacrylate peracid hydrolase